jgi:hypothetical protein
VNCTSRGSCLKASSVRKEGASLVMSFLTSEQYPYVSPTLALETRRARPKEMPAAAGLKGRARRRGVRRGASVQAVKVVSTLCQLQRAIVTLWVHRSKQTTRFVSCLPPVCGRPISERTAPAKYHSLLVITQNVNNNASFWIKAVSSPIMSSWAS